MSGAYGKSSGAHSEKDARSPLTGIRVLDFTHVLAGPFCTRLLADFGADVVRVESRRHPDSPWKSDFVDPHGRPASYFNTNRSKRSIAIDLKTEAGRALATRLATVADVVAENFSAGVMARLELDYESLRPLNPALVYVSMSGYGHRGPRRDWTSMNMNLQAYSGLMMVTGSEADPPTAISNSWNDYIGGLHACFSVLQALMDRSVTGRGTHLDLSQFECSVATLGSLLLSSIANKDTVPRLGNRATHLAPQGVYRCAGADEWCAISVQTDEQWHALAMEMGNSHWGQDRRFCTVLGRMRAHDEIDDAIEAWTSGLPSAEVERCLKALGVPAERMRRIQDLIAGRDGAQVFQRMEDPGMGSMLVTWLPFSASLSPFASPTPAPILGQHTREVLREWLGLSDREIGEFEAAEVLV